MKTLNKCYYRATIALCESLANDGVPVEFYKEGGYFLFGINGEDGWTDCLRTESIREVWEWVSELRKEGE
jgi:hypothetical protein